MANRHDSSFAQRDHAARPFASGFTAILRQSMERLRPWMCNYVKCNLDWSASENDFTDRIIHRLTTGPRTHLPENADAASIDEAVKTTLKFLVHEEKRATRRKQQAEIPADSGVPDPNSSGLQNNCETELLAREVLSRIPSDLLPIVKSLYGLHGEAEMTIRAIARSNGIPEATLRQKLCRLRARLRKELGAKL